MSGSPTDRPPPDTAGTPPAAYGAPGAAGPPNFGLPLPPALTPAAELKKQATTWIVIAVVTFVSCAGVNCLGLIGAILCFLATQAVDQGNFPDAEAKLRWGKILVVVGTFVSFALWVAAAFTIWWRWHLH